ncbi:hypothetical protein FQR65_LT05518 [Abscondita terminalis]|nr:hypothetical protein FQR65_LT05518 [Abscondita terminalis]
MPPGKSKTKKSLQTTLGKAPACVNRDEIDLSHVQKPIDTSIFGLRDVLGLFTTATKEVQNYVTYECDIMYECRMCRTIFRSLANFVLHKRKYCRDLYRSKKCGSTNENLGDTIIYMVSDEEEKDVKNKDQNTNYEKTQEIGLKTRSQRNLGAILPRLIGNQESTLITDECVNDVLNDTKASNPELRNNILLEKIHNSNSGVFQTAFASKDQDFDYMKTEVMEIHNVLESNEAVIGPDGKIVTTYCDSNAELKNNLTCTKCNEKFLTKKTLRCHVKYRHNDSKKIYKCTDCSDTFANTWGVFRHLYKAHRKTPAQVKKLRTQICNNLISKQEESELISNEESTNKVLGLQEQFDLENKQWINDLECNKDLQMCGGCGRKFERKAALNSHSHFCNKRIALCNSIKENKVKKLHDENEKMPKLTKIDEKSTIGVVRRRKPLVAHKILRFDCYEDDIHKNKDVEESKVVVDCVEENVDGTVIEEVSEFKKDTMNLDAKERHIDKNAENLFIVLDTEKTATENCSDDCSSMNKRELNGTDKATTTTIEECKESHALHFQSNNYIDKETITVEEKTEKVLVASDTEEATTENCISKVESMFPIDDCSSVIKRKLKDTSKTTTKRKCKEWHALYFKSNNYIDKEKITCLPCAKVFKSNKSLMKHMAGHFNWNRYQCKNCSYKSYQRSKCENHCESVHRITDKDALNECVLRISHKKIMDLSTEFIHYANESNNLTTEPALKISNNADSISEIEEEPSSIDKVTTVPEQNKELTGAVLEKVDLPKSPNSSVRKMIMEVIFGSEITASTTLLNENKNDEGDLKAVAKNVDENGDVYNHEETEDFAAIHSLKDSRPVRNRTATVKEDFLYDMTQILKLKPSKEKGPVDINTKQKPLKIYTRKTKLISTPNIKGVNTNKKFKVTEDVNMNNKTISTSNNTS